MINLKSTVGLGILSVFVFSSVQLNAQGTEKKKVYKEFSGEVAGEYRYFFEEGAYPGQHQEYFSTTFSPEFFMEWEKRTQSINFSGFARLDQYDDKRTHADIRELYWQKVFKKWELSVGAKKIFWGVAESNHLVDVINQYDLVEGIDPERKLGQAMIHASVAPKWGTLDFFVMSYFREMTFPGENGRLRPPFDLDYDGVIYESDMEEFNPDVAVRWSHSIKVFDIGVSHFYGTSRQPFFTTTSTGSFVPNYELINQSGLDLQASTGNMLWKLEVIHRESKRKTITGATVGGEYTFSNVFNSGMDIGILGEYLYDDRGDENITGLNDDIFGGVRIAVNDKQSTDFLGGVTVDRDSGTQLLFIEASRRIGSSWKLSVEARGFNNVAKDDFIYLIKDDGLGQVTLTQYF